jgi:hypothetical protein
VTVASSFWGWGKRDTAGPTLCSKKITRQKSLFFFTFSSFFFF